MAALVAIGVLSVTGSALAEGECALASKLGQDECENSLREERWQGRCYRCQWGVSGESSCSRSKTWDDCLSGTILFGAKGARVEGLQRLLKSKSFDVEVTGVFDEKTKKAVEAFQKQQKILKDGKVGPDTLGKLLK